MSEHISQDENETVPDESRISGASSWDEGQHQQQQQQSSGEDTASESTARHHKVQSWSGAFVGLARDVFTNSRPPLPSPPQQRRHSATEEDYHRQNQKFLQQAAAAGLINARSKTTANSSNNYGASPSPNTQFRKRLQLKAIEEDDGQQSFVLFDGGGGGGNRSRNNTASSSGTNNQQQPQPTRQDSAPATLLSTGPDDWTSTSIKFQENSDDLSVMSSLAGSYHYTGSYNNNNNTPSNNNNTRAERLRLAKFEQEQEERFQEKKRDMERKLSLVLQHHGASKVRESVCEVGGWVGG